MKSRGVSTPQQNPANRLKPSLIFTDWNMPNMNGIDFVKQYRASGAKTPIIMVTTEAEKVRVVEALQAGVNNYLVKPFKREEFFQRVAATCKTFNLPQILNMGNDQAA
jgi:DNA-binding response OmpR family regulator